MALEVKEYGCNVIKVADLTYLHGKSNIKPVGFVIELCRCRTALVITTDAFWLRFTFQADRQRRQSGSTGRCRWLDRSGNIDLLLQSCTERTAEPVANKQHLGRQQVTKVISRARCH
jgi:hypothetical protein